MAADTAAAPLPVAPLPVSPLPASPVPGGMPKTSRRAEFAAFWSSFAENKGAVAGLVIVLTIMVVAIFAPVIAPHSPIEQFRQFVKLPPAFMEGGNWSFPLGTDAVGRDLLSRIIYGARISLFIGFTVTIVSVALGIVLGVTVAFTGGMLDIVVMRLMDLIVAVPSLVLAILIVAVLGPSLANTIIAVTIVYLPRYVRVIRAATQTELTKEYVVAARVSGVRGLRLMMRTVLPNCLAPIIVQAALGVSDAILEAAALGFLGLGAQPPIPEWGAMLSDSREFIRSAPWIVTLPGLAILVTVIAINLVSDGLRDALDPKLKRS
jgi:dipeptide transport system permease protein